jgi:hypothetical protein
MTDNHSTDQNNNNNEETNVPDNNDEQNDGIENELEESTQNCMNNEKIMNRGRFDFLADDKFRDTASNGSNGVKRRKKIDFFV